MLGVNVGVDTYAYIVGVYALLAVVLVASTRARYVLQARAMDDEPCDVCTSNKKGRKSERPSPRRER